MKTKNITIIGLMAAIMCIMGPLSIPIPVSPVPLSFGLLAVYLTVYILGTKKGAISICIYILLGLAGLPVFTGFGAGIGKVLGPTGGYLVGYVFVALISGFFIDKWQTNYGLVFAGMLLGTAVLYLFGTIWLAIQGNMSFLAALAAGVLPYIPFDVAKMIITMLIGIPTRKCLLKAGVLEK